MKAKDKETTKGKGTKDKETTKEKRLQAENTGQHRTETRRESSKAGKGWLSKTRRNQEEEGRRCEQREHEEPGREGTKSCVVKVQAAKGEERTKNPGWMEKQKAGWSIDHEKQQEQQDQQHAGGTGTLRERARCSERAHWEGRALEQQKQQLNALR